MILGNHFLIIISAPSGTGKSTIIKKILEKYDDIKLSVSCTTRQPRNNEIDSKDYYFISQDDFDRKVKNNEFLEYAGVYGKSYGTLTKEITTNINTNDIIIDIDHQGKDSILKKINKSDVITIFIIPPSIKELENRLKSRFTDSEEIIQKRMKEAKSIISHSNEYDYIVLNDDLDTAINEVCSIINHKRVQRKRNYVQNVINNMLKND